MPRQLKTPDDRAAEIEKQTAKVKKRYKLDTKKRRKVTDVEKAVIIDSIVCLRVASYTNSQIASIVGISKGQVKEIVADEKVQQRILFLKDRLPEAAVQLARSYLIEAVQAVVHVLRTEKDNALVLKAAAEIFDRFGLPKLSRAEVKTGDSPDAPWEDKEDKSLLDNFRSAPPEIQEKAAQLHEMFEEGLRNLLANDMTEETDATSS